MIRIGSACFLVATLSMRFIHPADRLWEDVADGVSGVFFGLAMGLLLWATWLNGRQKYSCS